MNEPMRRKGLADYYKISLRKVDYILKAMRDSGKFKIVEGGTVLVDKKDFEWALAHREEL